MKDEYATFVRDRTRLLNGREVVLTLRDLTPGRKKYRGINVRAVVSQPPRPGDARLWVWSVVGLKDPSPYSIKIVKKLPELFDAAPYSDFFEAMEKAERK